MKLAGAGGGGFSGVFRKNELSDANPD